MARSSLSTFSATPVSELEPREPAVNRDFDQHQLDSWKQHGTRGGNPRPDETVAEELVRKGVIYDGEHVTVVEATTLGVSRDGSLEGEVAVQRTPYDDPEPVTYSDIELPSDASMRRLAPDLLTNVPTYYAEEIARKEAIIDACPIDVYSASINPAWGWPWKLQSYYEARPGASDSCETLIIDSGFNRWGSPNDVLQAAAKTDAGLVMATDVTGMEDPSRRGHNDSMPDTGDVFQYALTGIQRFIDRARELDILDRVMLPVQPDYLEFLDACEDRGWLAEVSSVSVGGLLGVPDVHNHIDALHDVRARLGDDYHIHALAPSTDPAMIRELRNNASLVDSLDVSTPERAPANDKIPDASWDQGGHFFPRGTKSSTIRAQASTLIAVQLAHMLSPLCTDETFETVLAGDDDATLDTRPNRTIDEWAASDD
jgi:hypothetical protein